MATSAEIREKLANELRLDLIGPSHRDDVALRDEILPDPPARWYLTGFLVPLGAAPRQKAPEPQEEMDAVEQGGIDDDEAPGSGSGAGENGRSRRKKPWRYRWPEPVRDEVLARLLAHRAAEEKRQEEERRALRL